MGEIIISIIETSIVYLYFNLVFTDEKNSSKRIIIGILAVAFAVSAINQLGFQSTIKVIFIMIIHITLAFVCFKGNTFEKILFGMSFAFIAAVSDQVTFRLADILFGLNLELLLVPGFVRYGMMVIYYCICLVCIMVVAGFKRNRLMLPLKYQAPFIIVVIGGIIAFDKLLDVVIAVQKTSMYKDIFQLTGFIYVLLLAIFIAMIFITTRLAHAYQETNELKEVMLQEKFSSEQYKTIKHSVEMVRGWKHDMKNQLNTVSSLVSHNQTKEALEYIDKIYGEMDQSTLLFQTGNVVLDAVISNKAMRAKADGIIFTCELHTEIPIPLTPSECTSVFGNILDNAIDANNQITDGSKWIKLKIISHNRMIQILMENRCDGNYEMHNGNFKSKKGEGHGIGLKQVERIVLKYGGFYRYMPDNDIFKILISIPENQGKSK